MKIETCKICEVSKTKSTDKICRKCKNKILIEERLKNINILSYLGDGLYEYKCDKCGVIENAPWEKLKKRTTCYDCIKEETLEKVIKNQIEKDILKYPSIINFEYRKFDKNYYKVKCNSVNCENEFIANTTRLSESLECFTCKRKKSKIKWDLDETIKQIQENYTFDVNINSILTHKSYDFTCKKCNHVRHSSINNIRNSECPNCYRENKKEETKNKIISLIEPKPLNLSTYSETDKEIVKYTCSKCGYIHTKNILSIYKYSYCSNCKRKEQYSEKLEKLKLKYNIQNKEYKGNDDILEIKCEKGHIYKTTNKNIVQGYGSCYICNPPNIQEDKIFNLLEKYGAVKHDRNLLYPKELDIILPDKFAIEYNGLIWHSYNPYQFPTKDKIENINKHLDKTELCEQKGIQLFHIFENEWLDPIKQEIWKSVINSKLGIHTRIYARKTEIRIVQNKEKNIFLEKNHLQGSYNSSINIGLYHENELVSIMTFGKSRFSKKYEYELLRFASKLNTTVVGGGSKLIKFFEETYKPKSLISYANRRWSTGNFYEQVGFEFSHDSSPNYFYIGKNSKILESRNKYQKHKLHKVLEIFDESKSESENMFLNGYRRIYDSGNKIYIKNY